MSCLEELNDIVRHFSDYFKNGQQLKRKEYLVSFTPRPLYPQGKSLWYPLDRRLGGPQIRSGHGGEEKNSQPLPGLEPPIIQLVA
jgi:hypothetical protein